MFDRSHFYVAPEEARLAFTSLDQLSLTWVMDGGFGSPTQVDVPRKRIGDTRRQNVEKSRGWRLEERIVRKRVVRLLC